MTYTVVVTREDGRWLADVPAVPGAHTWARSLDGLVKGTREAIIVMADLPDDAEVDVALTFEVEDEVVSRAAGIGRERVKIAERERVLHRATSAAVRELTEHGYSVRDSARMLSLTAGRVSQLVNE